MADLKTKKLDWGKKQDDGCIYADCPQGYFCIEVDDGYSYQLFDNDGYPTTDAEGADSLNEAKQLCQNWLQEMVDKAMEFVEDQPKKHCESLGGKVKNNWEEK